MSDSKPSTALGPLFRAQRTLIDSTIETQRAINSHGLQLTRQSTKALVGVFLSDTDAEGRVDDVVDGIDEASEDVLDEVQETATDGVDAVEETVGTVEETTEETDDAADTTEEIDDDDATEETDDAVTESTQDTLDTATETTEATVDATADAVEETTDAVEAAADDAVEAADDALEGVPVETLDGIGPTYSSRLEEAGFGTVRDLAAASVEEVAEAAQVGTDRAAEWVERAQSQA